MKNVIFTYDTIQNGERGEACATILVDDAQAWALQAAFSGKDPTTWAEEVAIHAATLAQVTASLTALRKVAHDSEILMEREEKA